MLDIGVYALSIVRSFMEETPTNILSQWKPSPTGSDEQATVLLQNSLGQMATVALSMHSKQPKRAMISCEKGYIEIMEYPRADKAVIVDAETGARTKLPQAARRMPCIMKCWIWSTPCRPGMLPPCALATAGM